MSPVLLFTVINQEQFAAAYNNKRQTNLATVALIIILSLYTLLYLLLFESVQGLQKNVGGTVQIVTQKSLVGISFRLGRLGRSIAGLGGAG